MVGFSRTLGAGRHPKHLLARLPGWSLVRVDPVPGEQMSQYVFRARTAARSPESRCVPPAAIRTAARVADAIAARDRARGDNYRCSDLRPPLSLDDDRRRILTRHHPVPHGDSTSRLPICWRSNPPLAHRAVNADRQIGLLLPCNVAVRADTTAGGDAVIIDAMDPQATPELSDQPRLRDVADEATAKLQAAIDSLAPPEWLPTAQERLAEGTNVIDVLYEARGLRRDVGN